MPTYQYACTSCAEQIEAVQRFTDDPLTVCPACGGGLRKVYSPVGIVFKGSGFYRTDSRNGSAKGGDAKGGDKEPKTAAPDGSGEGAGKGSDKKASSDGGSASPEASRGKPAAAKSSQPASAASGT